MADVEASAPLATVGDKKPLSFLSVKRNRIILISVFVVSIAIILLVIFVSWLVYFQGAWDCLGDDGKCIKTTSGQFSNYFQCNSSSFCKNKGKKYDCDTDRHSCIVKNAGQFDSKDQCEETRACDTPDEWGWAIEGIGADQASLDQGLLHPDENGKMIPVSKGTCAKYPNWAVQPGSLYTNYNACLAQAQEKQYFGKLAIAGKCVVSSQYDVNAEMNDPSQSIFTGHSDCNNGVQTYYMCDKSAACLNKEYNGSPGAGWTVGTCASTADCSADVDPADSQWDYNTSITGSEICIPVTTGAYTTKKACLDARCPIGVDKVCGFTEGSNETRYECLKNDKDCFLNSFTPEAKLKVLQTKDADCWELQATSGLPYPKCGNDRCTSDPCDEFYNGTAVCSKLSGGGDGCIPNNV